MSTSSEYDFAGHDDRIRAHYDHAREKHPYFCDWVFYKYIASIDGKPYKKGEAK